MRLRRLECFGFKSFADRVSFDYGDGVTAIIGPNGCGKSNVVDAIKWVMGEQSAKSLRGAEMIDVIFNGCATRRAMAFCEVTLVMDQVEGLDGAEVAITRRLFRDGSSHYYLNGKSARLRDIKDLFLGTGAGTTAYSVIEQGRVGFILESNTKERRVILEEAAGISKYRARRRLAARKLERVEGDVQRIGEVLSEVRRRARQVQRQATAALRWKELSGQVRELRLAFALDEWGRLSDETAAQNARRQELDERHTTLTVRLAQLDTDIVAREAALIGLDHNLREVEEARGAATSRRDVARARATDLRARLAEVDRQEAEDRHELSGAGERLARLAGDLTSARRDLSAAEAHGGSGAELLAAPRAAVAAAQLAYDAAMAELEQIRTQRQACQRELARVSAEHNRVALAMNGVRERRARLEERSGGTTGDLAAAADDEAAARGELEAAIASAAGLHHELDDRRRESAAIAELITANEAALNDARQHEARLESTLKLLSEQDRRADGVARGPREVIAAFGPDQGVVGLVADLFRVEGQHVVAIETALGGAASHVVVETADDAKRAIDHLKRDGRGRATFLPLDDLRGGERIDHDLLREPGVIDLASRLVEHDARFARVFEFLLGNVLIVADLERAIALRRRRRIDCRIVTLDGEVIVAGGAMTGGRGHQQDGGGLISRKHDLATAGEELTAAAAARAQLNATAVNLRGDAARNHDAAERIRKAIAAGDATAAEARARLAGAERDRTHLEKHSAGFGAELEEIAQEQTLLEQEGRDLSGQREWFGGIERTVEQRMHAQQERIDICERERAAASEALNEVRMGHAAGAERLDGARQRSDLAAWALADAEQDQERRVRRLEQQAGVRAALTEQAGEQDTLAEAAASEAESIARGAKQQLRERDGARHALEEAKLEVRTLTTKLRSTDHDRTEIHVRQAEIDARANALAQRIADDFQLDLGEMHRNWTRPGEDHWDGARERLDGLERELAELGPVNLAALDELEEAQTREAFLATGHDDLVAARDKLNAIIGNIDDTCRRLFDDTYRQVRTNFQALFRKLFGGGSADLKLERWETVVEPGANPDEPPREVRREVDVLEAGLEIMAQPPGKNPKIITQLSGGEKALTAIALLFAVYQTRPSPFCILDEVDAPLDDANVDVYNNVVREFVRGHAHDVAADGSRVQGNHSGSQFIVITHKKRTMQRADAIYGITQNERGVSTTISVTIDDVDTRGELVATVRGAGPYAQ